MPFDPNQYLANDLKSDQPVTPQSTGFDPAAYVGSSPAQQPSPTQNQSIAQRYAADTSGNSKFYPDTNVSKGQMAASSFIHGATSIFGSGIDFTQPTPDRTQALMDRYHKGLITLDQVHRLQKLDTESNKLGAGIATVESENPTLSAAADLAGQAAQMEGQSVSMRTVATPVLEIGAQGLKEASQFFMQSALPKIAKIAEKVGGPAGLEKLANVLDDYGVTNAPATLRMLKDKLNTVATTIGGALETGWKNLDSLAKTKIPGSEALYNAIENFKDNYLKLNKTPAPDNIVKDATTVLENRIKPGAAYTHTELGHMASDIQDKSWDSTAKALKTTDAQVGFALRRSNLEMAAKNGISEDALKEVADASSAYNKVAATRDAVRQKLASNSGGGLLTAVRHLVALKAGPLGLAADAAYTIGKSTLGKTSAAAAAKLGSKVLAQAAELGPFQKIVLNKAAKEGIERVGEWHLKEMLKNPNYNELWSSLSNSSQSK